MRDETHELCAAIVASGFKAEDDPLGRFLFSIDDVVIKYRGYSWIVSDPVYGETDYASLQELMINEYFRWNDNESD